MEIHLVDGTYELFRYHYSPNNRDADQGATRGVVNSMLQLVEDGATHIGIATDQVIESFRNDMWDDYKDGSGVDPQLKAQFVDMSESIDSQPPRATSIAPGSRVPSVAPNCKLKSIKSCHYWTNSKPHQSYVESGPIM